MIKQTIKQTMLALALTALCAAAFSKIAPAEPAGLEAKKMEPSKFAEQKQKLLDQRAKTTACITVSNDPKSVMECLRSDHESMKAMHGDAHLSGKSSGVAPVPAPASK